MDGMKERIGRLCGKDVLVVVGREEVAVAEEKLNGLAAVQNARGRKQKNERPVRILREQGWS